ncbi:MAG: TIR domain-containing protein, partial [Myxococcota bacterium]
RWIDSQLNGTSVTVVLVGALTCSSRWVKYEIAKSKEIGNGLLGIDISGVRDMNSRLTTSCCGRIPAGYSFYNWVLDDGYNNLGSWIESAARAAGR